MKGGYIAEGSCGFASHGSRLPYGTKLGLRIVLQPMAETGVIAVAIWGIIHQRPLPRPAGFPTG